MSAPTDAPYGPNDFQFCGMPYLILSRGLMRPREATPAMDAVLVLETPLPVPPGEPTSFVPMFTDPDLAERFIAGATPEARPHLMVHRSRTVEAFVFGLVELGMREGWVSIDPAPDPTRHRLYPIASVIAGAIEAIRAHRRGASPQ